VQNPTPQKRRTADSFFLMHFHESIQTFINLQMGKQQGPVQHAVSACCTGPCSLQFLFAMRGQPRLMV